MKMKDETKKERRLVILIVLLTVGPFPFLSCRGPDRRETTRSGVKGFLTCFADIVTQIIYDWQERWRRRQRRQVILSLLCQPDNGCLDPC